jgi:hypothetical protein
MEAERQSAALLLMTQIAFLFQPAQQRANRPFFEGRFPESEPWTVSTDDGPPFQTACITSFSGSVSGARTS